MEIQGAFKIGIMQNDRDGHELHLDFTAEFRAMNVAYKLMLCRLASAT
jgi:hypothetical protein